MVFKSDASLNANESFWCFTTTVLIIIDVLAMDLVFFLVAYIKATNKK